jgi:hypothetical protein
MIAQGKMTEAGRAKLPESLRRAGAEDA